jgi:DNA-binding MarR family transcriptional regulator
MADDRADRLDSEILDVMTELAAWQTAITGQVAEHHGLPRFCLRALLELAEPMPMKDLGQKVHCDPSFVTAIADMLEKRGLARRENSITDRRVKNLVLTARDVAAREQAHRDLLAAMPWLSLGHDDRAKLLTPCPQNDPRLQPSGLSRPHATTRQPRAKGKFPAADRDAHRAPPGLRHPLRPQDCHPAKSLTQGIVHASNKCFSPVVLGLRAGCCPDPVPGPDGQAGRHLIRGLEFKTATDEHGNHRSAGAERTVPWVAITPVVNAIRVLERMVPDGHLLFDHHAHDLASTRPGTGSLQPKAVRRRIGDFAAWANREAASFGLPGETIPADPHGDVGTMRFRRIFSA